MRTRVETPDLGPPEAIRPAPVKGDTFVQAQRAPIDNSLEQLQKGLHMFGLGAQALVGKFEDDEKQRRMAEYQAWRSSTTNADQVAKIWSGEVPYYKDPYIGAAVRKDFGGMKAVELSGLIDQEIASGKIPIGSVDFNIEKYVLEKAAPTVEQLKGSYEAITAFRAGLDSVRQSMIEKHHKARGEAAKEAIGNVAFNQFSAAFESGALNGQSSALIMQGLRKMYSEFGPREQKGSLDLQYREMDQILLRVLEDKAENPALAERVIQVLHENRVDEKTGTSIGPLSQINKHADKVQAIQKKALGTLAEAYKEGLNVNARAQAEKLLEKPDGSFSTIQDIRTKNPYDNSDLNIDSSRVKEDAVLGWLAKKENQTVERQLDVIVGNGLKHPVWVPKINSAFVGFLNSNLQSPEKVLPEQIASIQEAARLYNTIASTNDAYADKFIDRRARDFFEAYTVLVRDGGVDPRVAATAMARSFSNETDAKDVNFTAQQWKKVEEAAKGIDFTGNPFTTGVYNAPILERKITDLAKAFARAGVLTPEDAIKKAAERVKQNGTLVNGHVVFGVAGLRPDDSSYITKILDKFWEQNKGALQNVHGIESASQLTVRPDRAGNMIIIDGRGPGLPVLSMDGKAARFGLSAVQALRANDNANASKKVIDDIIGRRQSYSTRTLQGDRRGRIRPQLNENTNDE